VDDLLRLASAWAGFVPPALAYSLARWNGRLIAPDHRLHLFPIQDHLKLAQMEVVSATYAKTFPYEDDASTDDSDGVFEEVTGPINPCFSMKRRYCIGGYEYSGTFLYLDYEDPPAPGRLGQVISIGEEPVAEYVAPSLADFLLMVANAPAFEDAPEDFDLLQSPQRAPK
jgi:hypothetical protein